MHKSFPSSHCVELQAEVGEAFLEEPSAEVVNRLADDGRVAQVEVAFFHLLELVGEDVVHQRWHLESVVGLAVVFVSFELVQTSPHVQHKLRDVLLAASADIAVHVNQKPTEDVVDAGRICLILMWLILLLMFLPIILDALQKSQVLLGRLPRLLIVILLLLREREKFIQVPLQLLNIVAVLYLFHRFYLLVVLDVHALILILGVLGQLGELWLAVVFGLDVGVQRGVAEVGLAAVAGKVTPVLVVPCPSLALEVIVVEVEPLALGGQV